VKPAESEILRWIDTQSSAMRHRLIDWATLNTGSLNLSGLDRFRSILRAEFENLGGAPTEIELSPMQSIDGRGEAVQTPLAKTLVVTKRPTAPVRIFLCIHMDTVYPADHLFQTCTILDEKRLQGPGVADAKGGLIVMLTALAALEKSELASRVGWEVLINPDEEIGSAGSMPLLVAAAARNQYGLLFEPATPDGALIDRRKGSGSLTLVIRGRAAHVGRDFAAGRNALIAASCLSLALNELNNQMPGITINIGKIEGGGPSNVVPDLAIVRFNVRTTVPEDEQRIRERVDELVAEANAQDGISVQLHGNLTSPPKIPDVRGRVLMEVIERCGAELNLPILWKSSGGACDGNKLAAAGLPNVDTLGPCGGNLHSPAEFVLLDSLAERAKLAALVMMRVAGC
jgi:glutamate carboxypeptidase